MGSRLAIGLRVTAVVSRLCYSSLSAVQAARAMAVTKRENLCPSSTDRRSIVVRHRSRERVTLAPPGGEAGDERQSDQQTTDLRVDSEVGACVASRTRHIHITSNSWPTARHWQRRPAKRATSLVRDLATRRDLLHQPSVECLTST